MINYLHKTKPYRHQEEAFYFLYNKNFGALFMEQGTGKTKTAIDLAVNWYNEGFINAVLVIAPSGVQEQWYDTEIPCHHSDNVRRYCYLWNGISSNTKKEEMIDLIYNHKDELKWFFINVEAFSTDNCISLFAEYVKNNKTLIIIDEATIIKNNETKRSHNIIFGLSKIEKVGRRIVSITPYSVKRLILTGTMVTNAPYDIWNMFEFLSPGFFGLDFFTFKIHYGIERKMQIPGTNRYYFRKIKKQEIESIRRYHAQGFSIPLIASKMSVSESSVKFLIDNKHINSPYKHLDELKEKISTCSFIVLKKDCLDLPPKIYEEIRVKLNDEQKKVYQEMKKELFSTYNGKELSVINKIALILRLQQITGGFFPYDDTDNRIETKYEPIGKSNPKIEALLQDLHECSVRPIIISARFTAEVEAIFEAVKKEFQDENVEKLYGKTQKELRAQIRDAFINGNVDILVVSSLLVRRGFNFQTASIMYIYSNDYSLETREQLEDRIHRDGQKSLTVVYKDIIAKGTVDEQVLSILKDKKDLLEFMRDKTLTEFIG